MYLAPPLETKLYYDGSALAYDGAVPASFGMDFVDVRLDERLNQQPLTLTFRGEGARFSVQVWRLRGGGEDSLAPARLFSPGGGGEELHATSRRPETVAQNGEGAHVYAIPRLDMAVYDRLALIITRRDSDERAGPAGSYRITLDSAVDAENDTS